MSDAEDVAAAVDEPTCAECGDAIERGYVPVRDGEPAVEATVCDVCGWTDVGTNGCAPTAADLDAAALVRVEVGEEVEATVTDERA